MLYLIIYALIGFAWAEHMHRSNTAYRLEMNDPSADAKLYAIIIATWPFWIFLFCKGFVIGLRRGR